MEKWEVFMLCGVELHSHAPRMQTGCTCTHTHSDWWESQTPLSGCIVDDKRPWRKDRLRRLWSCGGGDSRTRSNRLASVLWSLRGKPRRNFKLAPLFLFLLQQTNRWNGYLWFILSLMFVWLSSHFKLQMSVSLTQWHIEQVTFGLKFVFTKINL